MQNVERTALLKAKKEYKAGGEDVFSRHGVFQLRTLYQKWLKILKIK